MPPTTRKRERDDTAKARAGGDGFAGSTLRRLPNELLFDVMRRLPTRERISCAQTCHFMAAFARAHERVIPAPRIIGTGELTVHEVCRTPPAEGWYMSSCVNTPKNTLLVSMRRERSFSPFFYEYSYAGDLVRTGRPCESPFLRAIGRKTGMVAEIRWFTQDSFIPVLTMSSTGRRRHTVTDFPLSLCVYGSTALVANNWSIHAYTGAECRIINLPGRVDSPSIAADEERGRFYVCSVTRFHVFDVSSLSLIHTSSGEILTCTIGIDVDDAGRLVALSADRKIRLFNRDDFTEERVLSLDSVIPSVTHSWDIRGFSIGRDGDLIILFRDRLIVVSTQ